MRNWRRRVIKTVNFIFYLSGETHAMQFVTPTQTSHDFTDFTDFANTWTRIAIFDIDASMRLNTISDVVAVIGHVTRAIFDEVIIRQKSGAGYDRACGIEEIFTFLFRHVQVDGFKQSAVNEPLAEIA